MNDRGWRISAAGPHDGQPVRIAGAPPDEAAGAVILVHGRGATAESILAIAPEFERTDLTYVAPQAASDSWYPYSFMAPLASNEPWLSSALASLANVLAQVNTAGVPSEKVVLAGFSQGACLASEFVARHARRYGGLLVFSGGLVGPPGTPREYTGSLDGTPIFLGCSDVDFHIPVERVHESAAVFDRLRASVVEKIYPNMGHMIVEDELIHARRLLDAIR